MKTFAMTTAGVENASCEFDVATLRPTYRLLIGIPGKSNAFAISQRLGLPQEIIQQAAARGSAENVRFEDVLTQLEEKRQRLEKAQGEADRLWQQSQEDARKARTFREQMEKGKESARAKGEAEAKRIVRQAQQQAEQARHNTGQDERYKKRDIIGRCQNRRGICADAHERRVAEGHLAHVADHQVQAEGDHDVHQADGADADKILGREHKGKGHSYHTGQDQQRNTIPNKFFTELFHYSVRLLYTLLICLLPNSPLGLMRSTRISTTNEMASR